MDLEALKRSIIIILKADGSIAGTGFVLNDNMAVTCAHVIVFAGVNIDSSVNIRFYAIDTESSVKVMSQGWSGPAEDDIAFLQLLERPNEVKPVLLRTAIESAQHTYVAFGFAQITTYQERIAENKIGGVVKADYKSSMLQLAGYEIAQGLSGAPVLDKESGYVVGMISEYGDDFIDTTDKKIPNLRLSGARFGWATTSDTLKARMPVLQVTSTLTDWQQWSDERRSALIRETHARVGDSPLMEHWQSFLANEPWIDLVKNAINRVAHIAGEINGFENLIFHLKNINTSTIYPKVRQGIRIFEYKVHRSVIKTRLEDVHLQIRKIDLQGRRGYSTEKSELISLRNSLYKLLDVLEDMAKIAEQSYNSSFLVLGRLGSGRTHFINQVVEQTLSMELSSVKYLCILLDRTRVAPNLEAYILQALSQATRKHWPDIRSWHHWMQTNYSHIKVILIIDDLQYWIAAQANFLSDLANTIIDTTHYRAFLWIITADTASYPRLQIRADIWSDYGFYVNNTPMINHWIVLENLNEVKRVGEQIIRRSLRLGADSVLGLDYLLSRNKSVYLQMPFVAWIFLDIQTKLPKHEYFAWEINFIQFVEYFWDIRWRQLLNLMKEAVSLQAAEEVVETIIVCFADMGSRSGDYVFGYKQVLDSLTTKNSYTITDVEYGLGILAHGDLIDIQKDLPAGTLLPSRQQSEKLRIRLYFEPFWDFHIAKQMFEHLYTNMEQDEVQSDLPVTRLFQQINPGALTFLLLIADQDSVEQLSDMPQLISEVALEKGGSAATAVYQAAVRASPRFQSFILNKLEQRTNSEGNSTDEGLFEQLNFVSEALRGDLTMANRLKLLRMRYPVAAQANFGDYVCYLVHTWLLRAQASDEIVLALPEFEDCEILGVTESLAKLTVEELLRKIRLERSYISPTQSLYSVLLNIFLQYALRYGSPENYRRSHHKAAEERIYFYEWFLYWVCELLVSDLGWEAYEMLKSHDWYDNASKRFADAFALRMRREANWALGYWYAQQARHEERWHFEDLVRRLAVSASPRDHETAFFLIRHTQPTGKRKAVRVRRVFQTVLQQLFLDPNLNWLVAQYYELFEVNFTAEEFRELENQRQTRQNRSGKDRRYRN
ncbi:MAG: hypothetical protein OHK0022_57650 [Roseiflexaceae bacterium]